MRRNRIELAIIACGLMALAIGIAYKLTRPTSHILHVHDVRLARDLEQRFGPSRHSEELEEWIIRDFFEDERGGVFVDVGANHYRERSNTYYLETALGWSGVAVEPQARFAEGYKNRPRTTFVPLFVSDRSQQDAVLYVPTNPGHHGVASESRAFAESYGSTSVATQVRTIALDDLLERLQIPTVDFLSLDIELAEPKALAGFSIERFRPRLVCVEAHTPVRQQILDYFHQHRYVLVGKYLGVDNDNFWFAPIGTVRDDPALTGIHEP